MQNRSPWIHELDKERKTAVLGEDIKCDVAIVGGGIAGISTAFFVLRNSDKKVVLLEGGRLGHGATGHNGGHITRAFEKPLHEMVQEFGPEMTARGVSDIDNAWKLLDIMYTEAGLDIPLSRFKAYLGFSSKKHVFSFLGDNSLRRYAGQKTEEILIADHVDFLHEIKGEYEGLYEMVPHEVILGKLETEKTDFIASVAQL